MEVIVAATQSVVLDRWRSELADLRGVSFRQGYGTQTVGDSDAAVMSFELAHDRYGGIPEVGRSQILVNRRGDGYPSLIVTTPAFAGSDEELSQDDLSRRVLQTLRACVQAVRDFNVKDDRQQIRSFFLQVDGLGFDRLPEGIAESAARQAFSVLLDAA